MLKYHSLRFDSYIEGCFILSDLWLLKFTQKPQITLNYSINTLTHSPCDPDLSHALIAHLKTIPCTPSPVYCTNSSWQTKLYPKHTGVFIWEKFKYQEKCKNHWDISKNDSLETSKNICGHSACLTKTNI